MIHSDAKRLKIRSQVQLASEVIASYWPMKTFVHHNPLHELEHLHFEEAVRRAQEVIGARGYLPNETYRERFRKGLISVDSIEQALGKVLGEDSRVLSGSLNISRKAVYKTHLLHGINSPSPLAINNMWEFDPRSDQLATLAGHVRPAFESAQKQPDLTIEREVESLGKTVTLVRWLDKTLGRDFEQQINRELCEWCAAFLDEGESSFSMPQRSSGFFKAWKSLSRIELLSAFDFIDWKELVASLSDSPDDVIIDMLEALAIPQDSVMDYFASHLSSLSGWAAFIKWRALHPDHVWQGQYPVDMAQYLAVRLVYEKAVVSSVCRNALGIDGNYTSIKNLMENDRQVYLLLKKNVAGELPEDLARQTERLLLKSPPPTSHDWHELAAKHKIDEEDEPESKLRSAVWRLRELLKGLEIPLNDVLVSSPEDLLRLLDALDEFSEDRHGPVWLSACETEYQTKLIADVSSQFSSNQTIEKSSTRPHAQAIFCIDVRSEPFRRHLESVGPYETLGFAGFFICFIRFQPLESNRETEQFPVVMKARNVIREVPRPYHQDKLSRYQHGNRLIKALRNSLLHNLKGNVLTPFVTVESLGWAYSIPFLLKTFAPTQYKNMCDWLKQSFNKPIATTLTIDKLSNEDAEHMVVNGQLAAIQGILHAKFSLTKTEIKHETLIALYKMAMGQVKAHEVLAENSWLATHFKGDELEAFGEELREVHKINPRTTANHKERITRTGFTLEEQVFTVGTALRMMGLIENFARIVLVCGHGSTSDNNPFESALDCGACGGNEGKANARVFAAIANKLEVRQELAKSGIEIPQDTYFIPAQVDTTTDKVELFDLEDVPATHRLDVNRLVDDLEEAGRLTSQERYSKFPEVRSVLKADLSNRKVVERSCDWSQVRPEWGLSGNAAFIIARREMTKALNLKGRTFLHSYDYLTDPEGKLLETLLTAPQVVTQWINMEHYFSTVDNHYFGAGNKVYHNVVGTVGVMFGTLSDLRTGLAWQTVSDGKNPYHEPLRLTTMVEAPLENIEKIIKRHSLLQRFYHNEWVHLFALVREEGSIYHYSAQGQWNRIGSSSSIVKMPDAICPI